MHSLPLRRVTELDNPMIRPATFFRRSFGFMITVLAAALAAAPASAQTCGNDASGFEAWVPQMRAKVVGQGISAATATSALAGVSYDSNIIRLDRSQRSFKLSFEDFYAKRVSKSLINRGQRQLQTNAALFSSIEKRFGVPGSILVAIWGLETNYGADGNGGKPIVNSLATLAYDCRRSEFFQNELVNALRIIDRRDMSADQLRGGWAGEIGPMQFLPSSYVKYAVDFDGDGRKDLMRSTPDMLASTANYFKLKGWQTGQPWQPGSPNYAVIQEWNKAEVYAKTIAIMATKLDGRSQ
jgi:lytic murein transglycosylase